MFVVFILKLSRKKKEVVLLLPFILKSGLEGFFSALLETLITAQLISSETEKDWSSLLNEDIWKQHWKD